MNRTQALAGAALLAALAVGAAVLDADTKADPEQKDVKTFADARDAGEAPDYAVYKADRSDGGVVYYGVSIVLIDAGSDVLRLADGGQAVFARDPRRVEKTVFIDGSPCRRRPVKSAPGSCSLRLSDGGERDFGDDNTMQAGQWIDHGGCVETPCAVFFETADGAATKAEVQPQ